MRLSLRAFLFVSLAIAALAPIAYLGPTQVARWQRIQRRDADRELRLASTSLALSVGEVLDANIRGVSATAAQIGAQRAIEPELVSTLLHRYREHFPACIGVLAAANDARPVAFDPNEPARLPTIREIGDRPYYREMKRTGRTAVSQLEIGRFTGVPTIHVCAPIWLSSAGGGRELLGSVVAALSLEYLRELTLKVVESFGDMQALVLDSHGRVIVDSTKERSAPLSDLSATALYALPKVGESVLRDGTDERGLAVRAASTQVAEQGLGWTVVVMRPQSAIDEQARRARVSTLIALLAALAVGVGLAFVLSSWLARPIRRLARYTQDVTEGRDIASAASLRWDPGEVVQLTQTVEAMVTQLRSQADALRAREAEQVVLARLRNEMEIAARLQSGILPKRFDVPGFEIAALMKPADEVGGDYYDVLSFPSGCWIAVGDVSGHGLNAGLVTLMLQSALAGLVMHMPDARPAEVLRTVNRLLVENIRHRLRGDDHVTMVLMHLAQGGRFVLAGGHEPTVIVRASTGACEVIENIGPWLGINLAGGEWLTESTGVLQPGDLIAFHSDGVVETGARQRNPFGLERFCAIIERLRDEPVQKICEEILRQAEAWMPGPADDDRTAVVVRYIG